MSGEDVIEIGTEVSKTLVGIFVRERCVRFRDLGGERVGSRERGEWRRGVDFGGKV